jgi:hypothetical protein
MTREVAIRRFGVANLRAAWWAVRAARSTEAVLRTDGLEAALAAPAPPPHLPPAARRGVEAAVRRRGHKCLVRSIVMQAWLAAHGEPTDLIIGVRGPQADFAAHAWLEGEPAHSSGPFEELLRRPARMR